MMVRVTREIALTVRQLHDISRAAPVCPGASPPSPARKMPRPTFIAQPLIPACPGVSAPANPLTPLSLHALTLAPPAPTHRTHPPSAAPTPLPIAAPSLVALPLFPGPPAATPSKTVVVWFRSDLRLHDHPALTHAIDEAGSGRVLPVYVFDPRNFGKTQFGFEKTGRYRAKFQIQSVARLRDALRHRGSDLIVRVGEPEKVLPALCRQIGASALMCHTEVSFDDAKHEAALQPALEKIAVEYQPMWANTLYHVHDLPFSLDDLPDVYTKYREQVQTHSQIRPPLPPPDAMPRVPRMAPGDIPTLPQLGLSEPGPSAGGMHEYVGGEPEALRRLADYVRDAATVRSGRSLADSLGADFSCRISPWLALGCVSPRKIYADLQASAPRAGQTTTYFELVWRDFFRYITVKYNRPKLIKARAAAARPAMVS